MKNLVPKTILFTIFLLFFMGYASGVNAPVTTIPSITGCPGGAALLPVTVTGFNGITAISLRIQYDTAVIKFVSLTSSDTALHELMYNDLPVSGSIRKILVAWSDAIPRSISDGNKLFDLNFIFKSGTAAITFNNDINDGVECEYAGPEGDALIDTPTAFYYINGQVTNNAVGMPGAINGATSVCAGATGIIYTVPVITNATTYFWNYSGNGETITQPGGPNSVTLDFAIGATSGNLTVYGSSSCGAGPVSSLAITVNPYPSLTNFPLNKQICNGTATNITLTSDVSGAQFTWNCSPSSGNVTGYSDNSVPTFAINQTLHNTGYSIETVTYHITPIANGCSGAVTDYTVTVYPAANVSNNPLSKQICSGSATNISLTSNVNGTTFTWTATLTSGSVTGFSSGSDTQINQVLVNTAYTIGTVKYHITPSANGCQGTAVDYIVTVYPVADVYFNPAAQTICSQNATNIQNLSHVAGPTFAWTASPSSANVTGFSGGSGSTISQTLTNSGTTPETVTYTVTPTANSCIGTAASVIVTVNPKPALTTTPLAVSICSGETTAILLTANVAGTIFTWTAAASSVNITGFSSGSGNNISQTLANGGATVETVTYHITPSANGCMGTAVDYVVSVNPVPSVTNSPLSQTMCTDLSTGISLTSTVAGATYTWTADGSSVNITGYSAGSGTIISQVLINTGNTNETATYHIIPVISNCSGPQVNYIVTVNPRPAAAGIVSGPVMVLPGQSGVSYSVPQIINAAHYEWTVSPGAIITSNPDNDTIVVTFPLNAVSGCISVHGTNNCGDGDESACLNVSLGFNITGTFTYNNAANTPLDSLWVFLKQNGVKIDSTRTNLSGNFTFTGKPNGIYTIRASTGKPFMGANGTDAQNIKKHFVGIAYLTTPIRTTSGDVNNTEYINGTDALRVERRFVELDNFFVRGDWTFQKVNSAFIIDSAHIDRDTIIISGTDIQANFYGLTVGDVNGTNTPGPGAKSATGINLMTKDVLKVRPVDEFDIPIYSEQDITLGAISLVLQFPQEFLEIEDIQFSREGMLFNVKHGEARIVWSDTDPVTFRQGEPVIILKAKATDQFTSGQTIKITATEECEFADENAGALSGIMLTSPLIEATSTLGAETGEPVINRVRIYPNPAADNVCVEGQALAQTTIEVTLRSILGQVLLTRELTSDVNGRFRATLNTSGIGDGVYIIHIADKSNASVPSGIIRLVIRKYIKEVL